MTLNDLEQQNYYVSVLSSNSNGLACSDIRPKLLGNLQSYACTVSCKNEVQGTLVTGNIRFMGTSLMFPEKRASNRTLFTAVTHAAHSFTDVYKISNILEHLCWK